MNPYIFALLALALVSFKPAAALGVTKLIVGYFMINPRVVPLWIV